MLFFVGCKYFLEQVPTENELLAKRLKEINWSKVDKFPTIANCEVLQDETQEKQCFFDYLSQTIQEKFPKDSIAKLFPENDSLTIKITISNRGKIEFQNDKIPKLDSLLQSKKLNFPLITPAIKQGMYVKSAFELPVILR